MHAKTNLIVELKHFTDSLPQKIETSHISRIIDILKNIHTPLPNTTTGLTGFQMADNIMAAISQKNHDFSLVTRAFGLRDIIKNFCQNLPEHTHKQIQKLNSLQG